jgi:hypothetical protein
MSQEMVIHKLIFQWDRSREALVFSGQLENGSTFSVVFPIAHVALTFDKEMISLGYCGEPLCGDVVTIEGFFSSLKKFVTAPVKLASKVALAPIKAVAPQSVQRAFNKTVDKVGSQAIHYARAGANFVAKQTLVPFKAAYDIASGKNVLQSLKGVAQQVQVAVSFVPGIGTLASMGLGGVLGAIEGKSLADIAKLVAAGAIPGGPLVVAAAQTAVNMAAAGIQGQNILKAARTELIKGAASMIQNPQLQALVTNAALAAASGQNVLKGAQSAAIQAALSQIPDGGARAALTGALQGAATHQIMQAAGGKLLTAVAAMPNSSTGAIVAGVVTKAKQAQGAMHGPFQNIAAATSHLFPAISAHGLAAHHVAHQIARNPAPARERIAALARSRHPSATMMIAALRSVQVH